MNDIFISRSVSEFPKDKGWYVLANGNGILRDGAYFTGQQWKDLEEDVTHWLEPTTLESLIAEHPEVAEKYRREGFEVARQQEPVFKDGEYIGMENSFTIDEYISSFKENINS